LPDNSEASQPQQSETQLGRGASGQQQKAVSVVAVEAAEAVAETVLADPGKTAVVETVGAVVAEIAVVALAGIVAVVVVAEIAAAEVELVAFLDQSLVSVGLCWIGTEELAAGTAAVVELG